jgi:hypothetical protein
MMGRIAHWRLSLRAILPGLLIGPVKKDSTGPTFWGFWGIKMSHDPIAYIYEADTHCPPCAKARFGATYRTLAGPGFPTYELARAFDSVVYGPFIAEGAKDAEGNPVGAIFAWDEWEGTLACGTCHEVIREAYEEAEEGSCFDQDEIRGANAHHFQ